MTNPFEGQRQFYDVNRAPRDWNPFTHPYTPPTSAQPVGDEDVAAPAQLMPARRRPRLLPPGKFVGGVVASAVSVCLLAWLLLGVIMPAIYRTSVASQLWAHEQVSPPSAPPLAGSLTLAAAVTIVAGALLWLMFFAVPSAVLFFRITGALASVIAAGITWASGPTSTTICTAVAVLVIGVAVTMAVSWLGEDVSTPDRPM